MPQLAPAQAAGAPQAGSADAVSIDWTKQRLDELQ